MGCFLEVFRDWLLVPEIEVRVRRISEIRLGRKLRLADCTSGRARVFGITAEIHSTPDYAVSHEWAQAFTSEGFDGVLYFLRHDPAQISSAVAWFGTAGAGQPAGGHRVVGRSIDAGLIADVERWFGIRVLPTP